jgi:hypothetical protein
MVVGAQNAGSPGFSPAVECLASSVASDQVPSKNGAEDLVAERQPRRQRLVSISCRDDLRDGQSASEGRLASSRRGQCEGQRRYGWVVDAKTRLTRAIAASAYKQVLETGYGAFFDFVDLAAEVGASETEARQAVRMLLDGYYLNEDQPGYAKATPRILLDHEERDRAAAYRQNAVRRHVLREAAEAGDHGGRAEYRVSSEEPFSQNQLFMAATVLEYLDLAQRDQDNFNNHFSVRITGRGYEVVADDRLMRSRLPINPTEDEQAQLAVAPDALKDVITSCARMLETRGWQQALVELRRGDDQYADGDWVNAVREYYSALESGLKYALHEEAVDYGETNALKKLSGRAAEKGLIPINYQGLFSFTDSIRSPRSHGGGPEAEGVAEVEIGQAEALLTGNHVRMLLLYLGQRPQV